MKKNSELFKKIVVVKRKFYLKRKADHYHKAFRSKIVHYLNVSWLENSDKIEMLLKLSAY